MEGGYHRRQLSPFLGNKHFQPPPGSLPGFPRRDCVFLQDCVSGLVTATLTRDSCAPALALRASVTCAPSGLPALALRAPPFVPPRLGAGVPTAAFRKRSRLALHVNARGCFTTMTVIQVGRGTECSTALTLELRAVAQFSSELGSLWGFSSSVQRDSEGWRCLRKGGAQGPGGLRGPRAVITAARPSPCAQRRRFVSQRF